MTAHVAFVGWLHEVERAVSWLENKGVPLAEINPREVGNRIVKQREIAASQPKDGT